MDERVEILRRIEAEGYQVRGSHDIDETVLDNSTTVSAKHPQTGESYTVTVTTSGGPSGELKALMQLAQEMGIYPA